MNPKSQIVVSSGPNNSNAPASAGKITVAPRQLQIIAVALSVLVVVLAIIVWGNSLQWHVFGTSTYLLFPIFGLVAFSLMWSQYIVSALRRYFAADGKSLETYFEVTSFIVLLAILLHPGLLAWQLWRDGQGHPPGSELHYVIPSLEWVVVLGFINLIILLLYELRRVFAKRDWWRWFTFVVDIIMFSIFYHALRLGTQVQHGWYRGVWWFYGTTLLIAIAYIYYDRFKDRKRATHEPSVFSQRSG